MAYVMPKRVRQLALTTHIAVSVGWIGAVIAYLSLDITVATSQDTQILRAAYLMMEVITRDAIIPLAIATLLTGIIMGIGTRWGLFRHYWVVVSLLLTVLATVVLLSEMQEISHFASIAADMTTSADELRALPGTLAHSGIGLVVLLVILVINVFKPQGLTPYGRRKQKEQQTGLDQPRERRETVFLSTVALLLGLGGVVLILRVGIPL
ncbi:DUF2269 domain-containing protein [Haloferax sp. AS1]|uniref:DUF2269 domain-containing protein n=1 Tax=Haloferax sp. AS1 TaxID=2562277 RepID=UPI00165F2899|nr:DUF2269 domain-containing protein [Haloferax sp. AS1]